MSSNKEIERRILSQRLGATYYSKQRVNIWSNKNREEVKRWASLASHVAQGGLAADAGSSLASILAKEFNHNFDAYDKAIDTAYLAGEGGGSALHHLLDGQHSIWGALKAVRGVSLDDAFIQELNEASEHLMRDLCSVSGINPLFSMSRETFDSIAEHLAPLGVSKMYLADALTVNGPEILGASLGILAMLLGRKSLDNSRMSELTGSLVLSSLISANPVLLPVAAYSMYKCCKTRGEMSWAQLCHSTGKGAIVTGTVATVSLTIGGPIWIGLAAGLAAAVGVRASMGKIERIWQSLWPAYEGFGKRFPGAVKQLDLSAINSSI